jgi:hypothetical protein
LAVEIPIRGVLASSGYEAKIFAPPLAGFTGAMIGNLRHGGRSSGKVIV